MTRWLVLGGTGTLGRSVRDEIARHKDTVVSAARSGGDLKLDISDPKALQSALDAVQPDGVINAAAIVDLALCEADPQLAHAVNAAPLKTLARWSEETGGALIHVSTDHFYDGDGDARHDESAPVKLINEYARSKHAGEAYALEAARALVVRTNVTGHNPDRPRPGFADWAIEAIVNRRRMTLFDDFFCSTLDAPSLARAMIAAHERGARGVLNIASSEVSSKWEFVHGLAAAMGIVLDWAERGSARSLTPPRGLSLGLDVSRAEALLGHPLPDLMDVCLSLASAVERTGPTCSGMTGSTLAGGASRAENRPTSSRISRLLMTGS